MSEICVTCDKLMAEVNRLSAELWATQLQHQTACGVTKDMAENARRKNESIEKLCNLVHGMVQKRLFNPSSDFAYAWCDVREAMTDCGYCERCGTVQCGCEMF